MPLPTGEAPAGSRKGACARPIPPAQIAMNPTHRESRRKPPPRPTGVRRKSSGCRRVRPDISCYSGSTGHRPVSPGHWPDETERGARLSMRADVFPRPPFRAASRRSEQAGRLCCPFDGEMSGQVTAACKERAGTLHLKNFVSYPRPADRPGGDFSAGVLESMPVTFRRPERDARGAANPNSAGLLIPKNLNTAALLFMGNNDG